MLHKCQPRRLLRLLLLAGTVALAGCGGAGVGATEGDDGSGIVVAGLDSMRFAPESITVKAGQPVNFVFRNQGVLVHDYISEGAERNVRLANVPGGRTGQRDFPGQQAGHLQRGLHPAGAQRGRHGGQDHRGITQAGPRDCAGPPLSPADRPRAASRRSASCETAAHTLLATLLEDQGGVPALGAEVGLDAAPLGGLRRLDAAPALGAAPPGPGAGRRASAPPT